MYPYDLLPGIDLYTIALALAIVSALVVFRIFADRIKIVDKLQNLCIISAAAAIIFGYFSAVFFQALYNIEKYGEFCLDSQTGATFYGGLVGGAAIFLLIYFVGGSRIFKESREHIKSFFSIADIAAISIAVAHALGRLGCLMAGCCHGKITDKWFGIYMPALDTKVVPIPLFEAIFLFMIGGFFAFMLLHKKRGTLAYYMMFYGAWRFFIEYARDDYRGTTIVSFLTPSQLIAILMVIGGAVLFFVQKRSCDDDKAV
jgi:phosphatidylglycerol:prolipoprotein diacylglycerol transferase